MKRGDNGIYYITKGTNAFISVKVEKIEDLGSHTMFIGTITDMQVLSNVNSVTYVYYLSDIKPKAEVVKTTPEGKTIWRCRIYGYEYEGEELPEDIICQICKHPVTDFEKVVSAPVEEIKLGGCHPSCCGHPMTELVPGTSDVAAEKHVPVVEVDGYIVNVKVGEVAHPMVDVHYIEWIAVETTKGVHRVHLNPGEESKVMVIMSQGERFVAAYTYCNLHGLWKA